MARVSRLQRHAAPYILGCLTGFLLSAFLFNLLVPSFSYSVSRLSVASSAYSSPSPTHPLSSRRSFSHDLGGDNALDHFIPEELELNGAAVHANHSTFKLLACHERFAPADSAIVPTRSHPSFPITVLHPKLGHSKSAALLRHGVDDVHMLHVLAPLFHGECGGKSRLPGLVVVQQADVGFLGMYAASVGCPVLMLETRELMRKALAATMCANPQSSQRVWLEALALNAGEELDDRSPVRVYTGLDTEEGDYREDEAEAHFDCRQPSISPQCQDVPSISLSALLSNASPVYAHLSQFPEQANRPIFLMQLAGDAASVRALLSASALLQTARVYHVLLPFRPHLLDMSLASELLRRMEQWGYEAAEIPYISAESTFSLFQSLKSLIASSFTSLASYTRSLRYDELDGYAEKVFECEDKRKACRVDLLFTLMTGRFVAGVTPFSGGRGS